MHSLPWVVNVSLVALCLRQFDLGRLVNCAEVAVALGGRYDLAVFPAPVSTCYEAGTTSQIFGTGRVVVVGCESQEHGLWVAHLLVASLWRTMRLDCGMYDFHIHNIVCAVSLPFGVNLNLLFDDVARLPGTVVTKNAKGGGIPAYRPEMFPGMSWAVLQRPDDVASRRITIALFESGNGVATGMKSLDQLEWCAQYLTHVMPAFRVGHEYRQLPEANRRKRAAPAAASKASEKRDAKRSKAVHHTSSALCLTAGAVSS